MKIKFRIRTILLMTLALGIALACLRWVQQERLKHTDALQAKFAEMGVHNNGFVPNVFPFQAEDGIRDCLLSRGLGDVYKRQTLYDPIASLTWWMRLQILAQILSFRTSNLLH